MLEHFDVKSHGWEMPMQRKSADKGQQDKVQDKDGTSFRGAAGQTVASVFLF